ncbi:hypothetical protein Poly51_58840 [Rubripirellula tenax]|uniref:Uncharacterized protein n=1 Tax=Rubripirellula tenax TaxID=2528015 RepID=A0A5C6E7P0_9BACT|nr:hypothetical protein Poly51_58840 [Rubripirellula tenax]
MFDLCESVAQNDPRSQLLEFDRLFSKIDPQFNPDSGSLQFVHQSSFVRRIALFGSLQLDENLFFHKGVSKVLEHAQTCPNPCPSVRIRG